jgi:hypothetical protein
MNNRLFLIIAVFLYSFQSVFAQDDGTTMVPIMEKTQSLINYIENDCNKEIVRIEMDILSSTKTTYRNLQEGYKYQVIAYGDFRFKDIDVSVSRWNGSEWVVMNKDADDSDMAIVTIIPTSTSDYKIEITAYKFNDGYKAGHYGIIVCHEK